MNKRSKGKCPICSKPASVEHTPFCCDRCRKVDLHRWMSGSYAIPTSEAPDTQTEEADEY